MNESMYSLVDLDEISMYVALKQNWDNTTRIRILEEYKDFLRASCDSATRPTLAVDMLWHEHILNTRSYEDYCLRHFGSIIHHVPCIDDAYRERLSGIIGRKLVSIDDGDPQIDARANCSGGAPPISAPEIRMVFANCGSGNPPQQDPVLVAAGNCTSPSPLPTPPQ
jgi:hypothetical protein